MALPLATANGYEAVVELLLANGVDVNVRNQGGSTALIEAAEGGNNAIAPAATRKGCRCQREGLIRQDGATCGHQERTQDYRNIQHAINELNTLFKDITIWV